MSLHNVQVTLGVSAEPRAEHDYYATDPVAAEWLERIEPLAPRIWECACGEGPLAKVFARSHEVKATDLIDRGYGEGGWTSWSRPRSSAVTL